MIFKYKIPNRLVDQTRNLQEFANGAAQITVKTVDGNIFRQVLLSDVTYFIAMRGEKDLPFQVEDVQKIYQTDEDKNPCERGGWYFWDDWKSSSNLTSMHAKAPLP